MSTATKGSFVPVEGHPNWFEVSTGGGTYIVNQETGECSCPAWEWRCSKTLTLCKHGQALAEFLDEQRQCAACHGHGAIKLRCAYPGGSEIPCAECSGTGLRQPEPLPSDAQLREMFR